MPFKETESVKANVKIRQKQKVAAIVHQWHLKKPATKDLREIGLVIES